MEGEFIVPKVLLRSIHVKTGENDDAAPSFSCEKARGRPRDCVMTKKHVRRNTRD